MYEPLRDAEAPQWVRDQVTPGSAGCWLWTGSTSLRWDREGVAVRRAVIRRGGKSTTAARVLWEELRGPLPRNIIVRHRCDVPLCMRLPHFELGTHRDNTRDALERGRLYPGGRPTRDPHRWQLSIPLD